MPLISFSTAYGGLVEAYHTQHNGLNTQRLYYNKENNNLNNNLKRLYIIYDQIKVFMISFLLNIHNESLHSLVNDNELINTFSDVQLSHASFLLSLRSMFFITLIKLWVVQFYFENMLLMEIYVNIVLIRFIQKNIIINS